MSEQLPLVVVVDDDGSMREALKGLMRAVGFAVEAFSSAEDFLASPDLRRTACLIADANLPGISGLDLHRRLVAIAIKIPTIIITAYPDERLRTSAFNAGVDAFLAKPFVQHDLLSHVLAVMNRRS